MKSALTLAALLLTSLVVRADDTESVQRCMDRFAARHFPDSTVEFVVKSQASPSLPLVTGTGTRAVQLVATSKASGRPLATATCKVRATQDRKGTVILLPLT